MKDTFGVHQSRQASKTLWKAAAEKKASAALRHFLTLSTAILSLYHVYTYLVINCFGFFFYNIYF